MRRRTYDPGPRAIDPRSGFEVRHADLVKDRTGDLIFNRFADAKHPQDFVRARPERLAARNARPEPQERAAALPILWEDGSVLTQENGVAVLDEGVIAEL